MCIRDSGAAKADDNMITATNFSILELKMVWNDLREDITKAFNAGRGRRFRDSPKDIFFTTLCCLKHRATWEWNAIGFNLEKSTFKRMVGKMLAVMNPIMKKNYIDLVRQDFEMEDLRKLHAFKDFPSVLCATDVVFQDANRPRGNLQEAMPYYSKKNAAYGYKTEVSVLANGQAIFSRSRRGERRRI